MKKTALLLMSLFIVLSVIPIAGVNAISKLSSDGIWEYVDYNIPGYSKGYMIVDYHGEDKTVTLPESIDGHSINSVNFVDNETLVNITIPRCYTSFGTGAFSYCKKLKTVIFSREYEENEITYFGSIMFANSKKLKKVILPNVLPRELQYSSAADDEYEAVILPDGTFQNCKSLTEVTLPENLTEIQCCAFENCTSITELTIPDGVLYLNDGIFDGCISLRMLSLPSTISGITSDGVIPQKAAVTLDTNSVYVEQYIEEQAEKSMLIIDNPTELVEGDINGDGAMDVCDVTFIQLCLVGKIKYELNEKADFDGNGKVNIDDATYIQMKLVNMN